MACKIWHLSTYKGTLYYENAYYIDTSWYHLEILHCVHAMYYFTWSIEKSIELELYDKYSIMHNRAFHKTISWNNPIGQHHSLVQQI